MSSKKAPDIHEFILSWADCSRNLAEDDSSINGIYRDSLILDSSFCAQSAGSIP